MKIIAVTNQKGGVAKTTTATTMAAGLRKRGYRVLLIDTDPQMNSTDTYRALVEDQATLFDVLCGKDNTKISEAIQHTDAGDIVASDSLLADAELRMTEQGREYRLREALEDIADQYDYIIIDTPPGLGILLTNALTAADSCIIPISADRYGLQGLSGLDKSIGRVRKYSNPGLKIDGFLFCKYNPNLNLSKAVMEVIKDVEKNLGASTYKTYIRETVAAREAQAARMTLFDAAPNCTAARDYDTFLDEFLYHNEGVTTSAFGVAQQMQAFYELGGRFNFFDEEDSWGIAFEQDGVKYRVYSGPAGGITGQRNDGNQLQNFILVRPELFPGEPAEEKIENWGKTAQSVFEYWFN